MDLNSPLRFLDIDVSRMIYENYFPTEKNKQWRNMVNDQFKYHRDNYLNDCKIENIYDLSNFITIDRRIYNINVHYVRYKRINFLDYLLEKCKFTTKKVKINRDQYKRKSWKRAKKFKIEAMKLKRNTIN